MFSPARRLEIVRGQFVDADGNGLQGATIWTWVAWTNADGDSDKQLLKCGPTGKDGTYATGIEIPADSHLTITGRWVGGQIGSFQDTDGLVVW